MIVGIHNESADTNLKRKGILFSKMARFCLLVFKVPMMRSTASYISITDFFPNGHLASGWPHLCDWKKHNLWHLLYESLMAVFKIAIKIGSPLTVSNALFKNSSTIPSCLSCKNRMETDYSFKVLNPTWSVPKTRLLYSDMAATNKLWNTT